MESTIVLVKDMTFAAASGQSWALDWVAIPAEYDQWQLVFVVKARIAGTVVVQLQTTWDTDVVVNIGGAAVALNAVGTTIVNIASGMGPMVRLLFTATITANLMFSAYLTPKKG